MHTLKRGPLALVASLVLLGACANQLGGDDFTRDEARSLGQSFPGTILTVRDVTIEGSAVGGGTVIGAVVGSLGAALLGAKDLVTVAAGAAGAGVGSAVEQKSGTCEGYAFTVRLDDWRMFESAQCKDEGITFKKDDAIYLSLGGKGQTARVYHR